VEPARGVREMILALALLAATAARGAEPPAAALDAEMLRDLDMLGNPNYARDRELGRKLRLVERLRMLEALRQMEAEPPATPTSLPTASPANPKEVK
jgi:hypothetical protein